MSDYTHSHHCPACGREADKDENICRECGAAIRDSVSSCAKAKTGSASIWYQAIHNPKVFSIITAALSLLLIIFAFCPFISVKTNYGEKSSYTTSFSPTEYVDYAFKAFSPYGSDKALLKSREYKTFEKAYDKIDGISMTKKLSSSDKAKLEDFTKAAIVLDLVSPDNNLKVNLVGAAAATIAYFCMLILALAASLVAIVKSFFGGNVERYTSYASRRLGITALFLPVYLVILSQASRFSHGSYLLDFGSGGVGVGAGLVLTLIPIFIITLFAAFKCYSKMQNLTEPHAKSNAKVRIVTMLLIVASVVAVFLPTVSVVFAVPKTKRSIKKTTEYVSPSDIYEFSVADADYYAEMLTDGDELIYLAETAVKGKNTDGIGAFVLHAATYSNGNPAALYVFVTIFASLFMILALTLLKRYVSDFLNDAPQSIPEAHLKLTIISAVIYLALCFALIATANSALTIDASYYVLFNVGIGPILAFVLILSAYIFIRLRPAKEAASDKFDNPDTSYAPYVIN